MNWEAVTATCACVSLIGVIGLFLMKAVIRDTFATLMLEIRSEFATKEHVETMQARIAGLEARFNDSLRFHAHGD